MLGVWLPTSSAFSWMPRLDAVTRIWSTALLALSSRLLPSRFHSHGSWWVVQCCACPTAAARHLGLVHWSSAQEVSSEVELPRDYLHFEVIILECECPTCYSAIGAVGQLQNLKGTLIRFKCKVTSIQVLVIVLSAPHHCKSLFLYYRIVCCAVLSFLEA